MYKILPLSPKLKSYLKRHGLTLKFEKQAKLLTINPKHPSLNTELLEPRKHGIYSFRIDRKYRALFILRQDKSKIEVLAITLHYK